MKRKFLMALIATAFSLNAVAADPTISFAKKWTHGHVGQAAEILAFDHKTNTVWVAGVQGVDVLNADNGELIKHIDVTPYGAINSVAIHNGLAAFAIEAMPDRRSPGHVVFYDTKTRELSKGINQVEVGSLPDMLTFTHDGSKLLVVNEGTPNAVAADSTSPATPYSGVDPAGTVSIIDMASRTVVATADPAVAPVSGEHIRNNVGMNFEPEYLAVNQDDTKAYVTLQEANAVGVLDLESNEFVGVVGLGLKDFSLADNGFGSSNFIDPSDEDPKEAPVTLLRSSQVKGLYQPDSVAAYQFKGATYLVMANEGDSREDDGDKKRVKDVAALLAAAPSDLKRLNISTVDSTPGDLVTFGGRSFSIRDEAGNIVYDSGNLLEVAAIERGVYDDKRSDDKGVEPEGVTLLDIGGRTYAFIGLERTKKAAVAVFDITNPVETSFVDMIVSDSDIAPEGLTAYHYRGNFYLGFSSEVSNTTSLYQVERVLPQSAQ